MITQFVKRFAIGAGIALAVVAGLVFVQPLFLHGEPSSLNCPSSLIIPTSIQGTGFLKTKNATTASLNIAQFVLKPNSTAFLQITYYSGLNNVRNIFGNNSVYFKPIEYWYKLGSNSSNPTYLSDNQTGIMAAPINVSTSGNQTLSVSYEISADSSAKQGAYVLGLPGTCGPMYVLTIGNSFYNGPGLTGGAHS